MAVGYGPRRLSIKGRAFTLLSVEETAMADNNAVEILLVEDNPNDVELALHALKKNKVSNQIHVVRDGEEALDFIFPKDTSSGKPSEQHPKMILLDLKLPK